MRANNLDGTLPAELGKLMDLKDLCAALRCRCAAIGGPVGAARSRARGGVQQLCDEQPQRHDRQLDRLDGEAHLAVSAAPPSTDGRGCGQHLRTEEVAWVWQPYCGVMTGTVWIRLY